MIHSIDATNGTFFLFRFPVHRLVMMSSSKYFHMLLGRNFPYHQRNSVIISNIDGHTLELIIRYCYTGNIQITSENIMSIFSAASALNLVGIEQKCEQFWSDSLCASNCVDIFLLADSCHFPDLRQRSFNVMSKHFEDVSSSELQLLEFSYFSELLKCVEIHVAEELVFQRLVQWVQYNEQIRSKYVADLFKLIRLGKKPKQVQKWRRLLLHTSNK